MTNSKNGASTSMANENATGNTNYQCLGDGQSMMDDAGQNSGSNNEQPSIGSNNEQPGIGSNEEQPGIGYGNDGGANASITQHGNDRFPKIPATNGRDFGSKFKGKQSFASLFNDNRAPNDESKLYFVAPSPLRELKIVSEDVDSVEKSFGFCLIVYVMGTRPSPYVIKNYIKGWGENVKFTFKELQLGEESKWSTGAWEHRGFTCAKED